MYLWKKYNSRKKVCQIDPLRPPFRLNTRFATPCSAEGYLTNSVEVCVPILKHSDRDFRQIRGCTVVTEVTRGLLRAAL